MKKIVFLFAAVSFTFFSFAQIAGNALYSNNVNHAGNALSDGVDLTLQQYNYSFSPFLEANVMVNVKAAAYTAIFSLTQNGTTIEETETMMQNRIDLFKKQMELIRITGNAIFIDPVSLVPAYEIEVTEKKFSKTINEVPSGFEMKKNIHVTFTEQSQINPIIAGAARAEVYDLVKVDYAVDNLDAILDQLRQEAVRILQAKKETLEKTGIHTRFTQTGERYGSVYPLERYAQYYAYKTGVSPSYAVKYKRGQPQQQVQYNYADKNKTIYYDKVSDKQFDKVINPVVGEPMVQVYITVKAQYTTYDPVQETADLLYNQKVKEIQLKEMELRLEEKKTDIALKKGKTGAK
ncbi:MAG: SIMPL domain-containing protein [Chitinophagaceae bacterium]